MERDVHQAVRGLYPVGLGSNVGESLRMPVGEVIFKVNISIDSIRLYSHSPCRSMVILNIPWLLLYPYCMIRESHVNVR